MDAESLERIVPAAIRDDHVTGARALELHLERYHFAAAYARPGRLLDAACGVGYGTELLTRQVDGLQLALGVDLSESAIAYAREHYANHQTEYRCADLMGCGGEAFDTVVSLETIEHLPDPVTFVERILALVRPGGVFVASVPTTPSVDFNPHHLHDFTAGSFRGMVTGLREIACLEQVQPFRPLAVLRRKETRLRTLRQSVLGYYCNHPGALVRRVGSTLRFGFTNRYLTVAWQRPG